MLCIYIEASRCNVHSSIPLWKEQKIVQTDVILCPTAKKVYGTK